MSRDDAACAAHGAPPRTASDPVRGGRATASNIGSTATIIGNPQNMLIGSLSGILYIEFFAHLGPVALAGLFLNWAPLHRLYLPASRAALLLITRSVEPRKTYDQVDWAAGAVKRDL